MTDPESESDQLKKLIYAELDAGYRRLFEEKMNEQLGDLENWKPLGILHALHALHAQPPKASPPVPPRKLHFVGSLPPEITTLGPRTMMRWLLSYGRTSPTTLGLDTLPCDPDPRWIINYLDSLAMRDLVVRPIRYGDSSDYDSMPIYRPTGVRKLEPHDIAMRRTDQLKAIVDDYGTVRAASRMELPPLQLSLPNPLDLSLFTFCGKVDLKHHLVRTARGGYLALRHLARYKHAMTQEVRDVEAYAASPQGERFDVSGGTISKIVPPVPIVWNLETPAVLYALSLTPKPLRNLVAKHLARQVASVMAYIWGVKIRIHLCHGDLANEAVMEPASLDDAVTFLNHLEIELKTVGIDEMPAVDIPAARGALAPPLDSEFYEPLEQLSEAFTDVVAGVADENNPEASEMALQLFEAFLGREASAVSKACGMGRDTEGEALRAVRLMWGLADSSTDPNPETEGTLPWPTQ